MANDYNYTITINNVITTKDSITKSPRNNVPVNNLNGNVPPTKEQANKKKNKSSGLTDALSAQMFLGTTRKLMSSIQNERVQSFTMTLGKTAQFAFKGVRALSGDVLAMVDIAVDVVSELITSAQQTAMQIAAEKNSVDEARVAAGALSLEGVSVSRSWWSGRYEYDR